MWVRLFGTSYWKLGEKEVSFEAESAHIIGVAIICEIILSSFFQKAEIFGVSSENWWSHLLHTYGENNTDPKPIDVNRNLSINFTGHWIEFSVWFNLLQGLLLNNVDKRLLDLEGKIVLENL